MDTQGHLKLTDMGLAKELDPEDPVTSTFCGTSEYLAPELLSGKKYGFEIDWWTIGVLAYELAHGGSPFYHQNKERMFMAIRFEPPKFAPGLDPNFVSFVLLLLEKDPANRGNFEKIRNHPFFANQDWEKVLRREYTPAYVPPVSGKLAGNFDTGAKREVPMDSLATPAPEADSLFKGFTAIAEGREDESEGEGDESLPAPTGDDF
jgi:serine/threonine protein kinase